MTAKRFLSLILSLCMILTLANFPVMAAATDPEESGVLVEQKVELTADNISIERYFVDDDWRSEDIAWSPGKVFVVDGDYTTYAHSDQYKDPAATAPFISEIIVDLGVAKNICKIDVHAGADHFGIDWWSYAAPVNPEILVAGEDGVYTSVYTREGTGDEAYRIDSVELDYTANGANVRYIKYIYNKIFRSPAVTEIEVTEMVVLEPTSYTVNYIDNNGDPVVASKVVDGVYVNDFVTENAPVVYGYDNVETEASLILSSDAAENVITFNYIKKTETSYTVNYVDEAGNPIADSKTVDNVFVGDEITEYAKSVDGYTLDGDSVAIITLVDGTNEITFKYKAFNFVSGPHAVLTHLTGANVTTDVSIDENISNLDKLFDGDATCYGDSSGVPLNENGLFGRSWHSQGEKVSVIVDLGDDYEISKINTYWGWAPEEKPVWNSWQYFVPYSYAIYAADTLEGLDTAAPVFVREGLEKDSVTLVANDQADVACIARFIKIEVTTEGGQFALRELEFVGFVADDSGHTYDGVCDPDCNDCGEIRNAGHTYTNDNDYTCNVCGYERLTPNPTTDFLYTIENGTATITEYVGVATEVIIPAKIEGYPVTSIDRMAFYLCTALTSITIPDSVEEIGASAFIYCQNLTSITIPDSVTNIGIWAFAGCESITSVFIPDSVTEIGKTPFVECNSLTEITVSEDNPNYSSVDGVLFDKSKTTLLEFPAGRTGEYTIPDGVTSIGEDAFLVCPSFTSITIPDSVVDVGYRTFYGVFSLAEINVSENNPNYSSVDGVLFNKNKTTLLQFPSGKMGEYTIPDGVMFIYDHAFDMAESLTSVAIPDSVEDIGASTFHWCPNLTDIYYEGSEADRENINIGTSNMALENATWHYDYCYHVYENACDAECNECGDIREVSDHVYDDDADVDCNECGEERILFVYGNANGDDTVDGRDVILLCQHLANYDYDTESSTVEIAAGANANGDNTVDGRDVILLCQYLANYDYDTGSSTVVLGPQQ